MSEFKAQILGLIIVLTIFSFVKGISTDIFDQTHYNLEKVYSTELGLKSSESTEG